MVGRIYLVIGGFHGPSKKQLDNISKFCDFISPAHCSGDDAKDYVKNIFKEKYVRVKTGSIIQIPLK
jgi:7,8-dihydropterin-6-yl-methyl-4-(beta-D-ribofuranosyl)aminobenzene 5'-phosphate synthase